MTLAIVKTRARVGMNAPLVTVEVHLSNGLPAFNMVGLPDAAVRESRERVRSAILNSEFEFPQRRITVNLAPADLPKDGGRFDLPIAIGILAASQQIPLAMLEQRRAMQSWRAKLSYTVDGTSWAPLPDLERRMAEVEMRLQETRRARESDLAQAREAPEAVRSLYVMSAATRAVLISQYEYRLAGDRHGFPAYYVPFQMPASGASPPQVIDVPAGRSAIVH